MQDQPARRGWRERIEPGIYRAHRTACESSTDHRAGRRCRCPLQVVLATGGATSRWLTIDGGLPEARKTRARAAADVETVRAIPTTDETLHDFAASWFQARAATLRPATLVIHSDAYAKRIAPVLGDVRPDELTRERLEAWLGSLVLRDPARRAVEQAVATLRAMLSGAVAWDRLRSNPALRLRMPKSSDTTTAAAERVLPPDQIERMLACAGSLRGETLLRCAVEAGLRRGEIIGLRWDDVLFGERRLRVRQSVWQGPAARGSFRHRRAAMHGASRSAATSPSGSAPTSTTK